MATQYTSVLKLALPVQGELSGTWGDVVNDNITSMVEEAIAGRAVINTWTANAHTLTTANGTTSESRCAMLEFTDTGAALTGAGEVICPTQTKIYIAKNASGQIITVKTSAGTGIAVQDGETKFVFCDGTNVVEAVTSMTTLKVGTGVQVSTILDEDDLVSDSATALATQQSIKAYVDAQVTAQDLDFAGDSGTGAVDLDSQSLTVAGTSNEIETSASGQTLTVGLPAAIIVTTSVTTPTVQTTNLNANDGTAAVTIADTTGQTTINDAVLTTADINAGTIDNTVIGASTAAAGSFTTVGATGNITSQGQVITDTINEQTATSGVTVDGVLLKDSGITATGGGSLTGTWSDLGSVTTIDINGGTIDGTVIGGSTAAAGSFTTLSASTSITGTLATAAQTNITSVGSLTSLDVTGTVTADGLTVDGNIQSQGTNPFIRLQETDQANLNTYLRNVDGDFALGTENDALSSRKDRLRVDHATGDISFYEDTGTTPKFFWDASAERLGLGTTGPSASLHIDNASSTHMYLRGSSGDPYGLWVNPTGATFTLGSWGNGARINLSVGSEYISFGTGSASTERMRIDSSGRVGIGTSSPAHDLQIGSGTNSATLGLKGSTVGPIKPKLTFEAQDGSDRYIWEYTPSGNPDADLLSLSTNNNAHALTVLGSGNVGIGTSSPQSSQKLHIANTSGNCEMTLQSSDSGVASLLFGDATDFSRGKVTYDNSSDSMAFEVNNLQEAMRIDSSGNLLVGTTVTPNTLSVASATQGVAANGATGYLVAAASGTATAYFNRQSTDGDIATFRKDGSTVGSIGTAFTTININAVNQGVLQYAGTDKIKWDNHLTPNPDNSVDLGSSSARFKDLYLSGGVYLGGTGSANKLDDYETGTWTPTIEGDSTAGTTGYVSQIGRYVRVGDLVHFQLKVQWSSQTGSGGIRISGLPFTQFFNGTSGSGTPVSMYKIGGGSLTFSGTQLYAFAVSNTNKVGIAQFSSGGGASTVSMDTAAILEVTGTYYTTA